MTYNIFSYWFFLFLFFSPHYLSKSNQTKPIFIIWNVGQGSWSSLITTDTCFHFDMGGSKFDKKNKIIQKCKKKQNILLLTHADNDHINFTYLFKSRYIKFCLYKLPRKLPKKSNQKYLKNLNLCNKKELLLLTKHNITEIPFSFSSQNSIFKKKHVKSQSNFLSRVFLVKQIILIGGDSTKKAELLWKNNILEPKKIKYFLLNHHGSKNSNHIKLLKKLKNLTMAIASAKKSRYKHPHQEVINRLKKLKIALLQTEIWGSLYIYLQK